VINPMTAEGQLHGGVVHGIGNSIFEWMGYDDNAQPLTDQLRRLPAAVRSRDPADRRSPGRISEHQESARVKGIGESGTVPAAAANDLRHRGRTQRLWRADRRGADQPGPAVSIASGGQRLKYVGDGRDLRHGLQPFDRGAVHIFGKRRAAVFDHGAVEFAHMGVAHRRGDAAIGDDAGEIKLVDAALGAAPIPGARRERRIGDLSTLTSAGASGSTSC